MPPARIERTTPGLGIRCSILLSYGGVSGAPFASYLAEVAEQDGSFMPKGIRLINKFSL